MSPRPPHAQQPRSFAPAPLIFPRTMSSTICPRCSARYLPARGACSCALPFDAQLGHAPAAIAARAAAALARKRGGAP